MLAPKDLSVRHGVRYVNFVSYNARIWGAEQLAAERPSAEGAT
ncbi:MAG: hypothetical protein ACI8UP_002956 [Porticoccaceae bacterium]|jgi:hypothetical protein